MDGTQCDAWTRRECIYYPHARTTAAASRATGRFKTLNLLMWYLKVVMQFMCDYHVIMNLVATCSCKLCFLEALSVQEMFLHAQVV